MGRKIIPFCILAMAVSCLPFLLAHASGAQNGASNSTSAPAQTLKARISAYADAQCKGKDGDAATKCRMEALWAATHCDPDELERQTKMPAVAGAVCLVPNGGFAFDIVSIKPHKDVAGERRGVGTSGITLDGYRSLNTPIFYLIYSAFNPASELSLEIAGGPRWLAEDRYDFEGKYAPEVADAMHKLSRDDYGFVFGYSLQQVLKDRMNFAAHIETKDVPAYDLVIGKNGPKLEDADLTAPDVGDIVSRAVPGKRGMVHTIAKGVPTKYLAHLISKPAGRPVFDKTGLTGLYDITLEYLPPQALSASAQGGSAPDAAPIAAPDPSGPSIFEAVGLLGLKLVSSRGPLMVIVIEHVEKPSGN
ncbi:MAG: TIGR03435 family protein [Candidatus Acidiferrales bacterium]